MCYNINTTSITQTINENLIEGKSGSMLYYPGLFRITVITVWLTYCMFSLIYSMLSSTAPMFCNDVKGRFMCCVFVTISKLEIFKVYKGICHSIAQDRNQSVKLYSINFMQSNNHLLNAYKIATVTSRAIFQFHHFLTKKIILAHKQLRTSVVT